jgi:hypothetical protein
VSPIQLCFLGALYDFHNQQILGIAQYEMFTSYILARYGLSGLPPGQINNPARKSNDTSGLTITYLCPRPLIIRCILPI